MTTLLNLDLKKTNGVIYNKKKDLIKKIYFDKNQSNFARLSNEYNGYKWYFERINKTFNHKKKITIFKNSNTLEISVFKGTQFNFWEKKIHKTELIQRVINHYNIIWPKKLKVPYHGDLTIGNMIFLNNNQVRFIDWENYKQSEDWGLDICYFLISTIVLPTLSYKRKEIEKEEIYLFQTFWKKVFHKKKYNYLQDPIKYIIKKINKKQNNYFSKITNNLKNQIYKSIM